MNCAPADIRDYFFDALASPERFAVRQHLSTCVACAAELGELGLAATTLRALAEEELPRRIAFVSDKVFEPSPLARFWQSFWLSGVRLGSAAAALLAIAIFVHAFRSVAVVHSPVAPAVAISPVAANAENVAGAQLDAKIQRAVAEAVAHSEARYDARLEHLASENEKQKRIIARAAETLDFMDRRSRVMTVASNRVFDAAAVPATGAQ